MGARSFYPTYFSIEDIMATEEKVPCVTNVVFQGVGFLVADSDEEDLNKGTSINAPLWLIQEFSQKGLSFILFDVPNIFKEKARDALEADASVVNLFRVNPYFYEFGLGFLTLNPRESDLIREILIKVFRQRIRIVVEWAVNRMMDPFKIQQLDLSEQKILKAGQRASALLDEWFVEGQFKMKPAHMVISLKKRKLLEKKLFCQQNTNIVHY